MSREPTTKARESMIWAIFTNCSSRPGRLTGLASRRRRRRLSHPQPTNSTFGKQEPHPLAALVIRLWSEREHGGIIELHLAGGAILLPDWFDRRLSQGTHGLFAAQAADATVTMTIVPWETVTRVVVRGVVGLPDGMFE